MIIAIDGPAGSGKSTVARKVADRLGFQYLDTGAMYRAVAYRALEEGIPLDDEHSLARIAEDEHIAFGESGPGTVSIAGRDVTHGIRTSQTDRAVSPVSAWPAVRRALTEQQRRYGRSHDVVMEGRDIGTVVFPDADLKVFLTARPEVRAHRRSLQNAQRGVGETDEAALLASILERDAKDASRSAAPLARAADAIEVDTSDMPLEEVISHVVRLADVRRVRVHDDV